MSVQGWAVTIAGVPWVFTTHDMGTLTSASPLWWGGESGVQYANGWLSWPRGQITERAKPLEGELDVSPLAVELHDAATSAGGSPLLTGLAGRDSVGLTSSPVASSVTAAATTITVGDGGLFSAPCFAWIEGECVRVTSVSTNTLTVTRGRLGTKAVAHAVDATVAADDVLAHAGGPRLVAGGPRPDGSVLVHAFDGEDQPVAEPRVESPLALVAHVDLLRV